MQQAVIIWGVSGSGKDTQAELLVAHLRQCGVSCPDYLSIGSLMRESLKNSDSFFAQQVKKTIAEGGLLPEFVPIWAWTGWLSTVAKDGIFYVMNGVARRRKESPVLVSALRYLGVEDVCFVNLQVSEEEVTNRLLKRGREDDTRERIARRIQWHNEESAEAVANAANAGARIIEVDGEGTIEEVFERVKKVVGV